LLILCFGCLFGGSEFGRHASNFLLLSLNDCQILFALRIFLSNAASLGKALLVLQVSNFFGHCIDCAKELLLFLFVFFKTQVGKLELFRKLSTCRFELPALQFGCPMLRLRGFLQLLFSSKVSFKLSDLRLQLLVAANHRVVLSSQRVKLSISLIYTVSFLHDLVLRVFTRLLEFLNAFGKGVFISARGFKVSLQLNDYPLFF
jgi:hypothetical protein